MTDQTLPANIKIWVVIPAAGVGSRMQADKPKQYLPLQGESLIEVTIKKFLSLPIIEGIVLALHPEDQYWQRLALSSHPKIHCTSGGKERSDSVLGALHYCRKNLVSDSASTETWVLVHDAARPCVSAEKIYALVASALTGAREDGVHGAILAARIPDTVKRVKNNVDICATEDRSQLWLAHTPQFFPLETLRSAIQTCDQKQLSITDEASAIELAGGKVRVVEDRRDNIKVTVHSDLEWAETILKQQSFD